MLDHQVEKLLLKVYRAGGTARSKKLLELTERREWALLQQERITDPSVYRYPGALKRDLAVCDFFRKVPLPGDTERLHKEAIATFHRCEAINAATVARLTPFLRNGPYEVEDEGVVQFITAWRKNVFRVLGTLPLRLEPLFTQGSTLSDRASFITIPDKMSSRPTVYGSMLDIWKHSVSCTPLDDFEPVKVLGNRFFSVVKDSVKRRGCCVESSGAVMLQRGAAEEIRRRYERRYKVDLKTAPIEIHRPLACEGSQNGEWCTVDLSDASDLICWVLVALVLPPAWFDLLNSLRAHYTEIDGRWFKLTKFSSMGNGFTFELMTLLLRTLCETIDESKDSFVFGDDIIIRKEIFSDVVSALRFFGLVPNMRKTFCEGPFRESCGGDYHSGQAVRPYSMNRLPDEPQHWIAIANGLRRTDPALAVFGAAWRHCVDQVPRQWRNFTSDPELGNGDGAFYDPNAIPLEHYFPPVKVGDITLMEGVLEWAWRFMRPVPIEISLDGFSNRVAMRCGALTKAHKFALRGQVSGYIQAWVPAKW